MEIPKVKEKGWTLVDSWVWSCHIPTRQLFSSARNYYGCQMWLQSTAWLSWSPNQAIFFQSINYSKILNNFRLLCQHVERFIVIYKSTQVKDLGWLFFTAWHLMIRLFEWIKDTFLFCTANLILLWRSNWLHQKKYPFDNVSVVDLKAVWNNVYLKYPELKRQTQQSMGKTMGRSFISR